MLDNFGVLRPFGKKNTNNSTLRADSRRQLSALNPHYEKPKVPLREDYQTICDSTSLIYLTSQIFKSHYLGDDFSLTQNVWLSIFEAVFGKVYNGSLVTEVDVYAR